jgi:hypothetical protein
MSTISFTVDTDNKASYQGRFSIVFQGSTLPVRSIVASATLTDMVATISWSTIGENNVTDYQVEKSTNGTVFNTINTVAPQNAATASYTFTDKDVATGNNYYRIKVVSANGSFSYSNVVLVTKGSITASYNLYPNPVIGNKFNVQFNNVAQGRYIISMVNNIGQKVFEQAIDHTGGSINHIVQLNNILASGVYSVVIYSELKNNFEYKVKISVEK